MMNRLFLLLVLIVTTVPVLAEETLLEFADPAKQQRYQGLLEEIRCLVCQNQTLADSSAELAGDLRREIYRMVDAGENDEVINDFLVSRYGDFVLYRPRFQESTWLLWVGPFAFLGVALVVVVYFVRGRVPDTAPELSGEEASRLSRLMERQEEDR